MSSDFDSIPRTQHVDDEDAATQPDSSASAPPPLEKQQQQQQVPIQQPAPIQQQQAARQAAPPVAPTKIITLDDDDFADAPPQRDHDEDDDDVDDKLIAARQKDAKKIADDEDDGLHVTLDERDTDFDDATLAQSSDTENDDDDEIASRNRGLVIARRPALHAVDADDDVAVLLAPLPPPEGQYVYDDDSDVVIDEPPENEDAVPKKRRAAVAASFATKGLAKPQPLFQPAMPAAAASSSSRRRGGRLIADDAAAAGSSRGRRGGSAAGVPAASNGGVGRGGSSSSKKSGHTRRVQKQVGFSVGCKLGNCLVCENGTPSDLDRKPPPANLIEVAIFTLMCEEKGFNRVLSGAVIGADAPDSERLWFTFDDIRDFLHHHWASLKQSTQAEDVVLRNNPGFLVDIARGDRRFRVRDDETVTLLVPRNVYEAHVFASSPEAAPTADLMNIQCVLCGTENRDHGVHVMVRRLPHAKLPGKPRKTSAGAQPAASVADNDAAAAAAGEAQLTGDWVHNMCLYYASRTADEDDTRMVARAKTHNLRCSACKERRATVGCRDKGCKRVFHLQCAKTNGEWHDAESAFYCSQHVALAVQKAFKISNFPSDCGIEYQRVSNWSNIAPEFMDKIAEHRFCWEAFGPMWYNMNLDTPLKVLPIGAGHWAYSAYLSKTYLHGHPVQYEVVAGREIEDGEVMGEYIGTVNYADSTHSEYVAALYWPETLPDELACRPLVIDAAEIGNETRYINSVNNETAHFIRQNATMNTVWCNGRLRVLISATRKVPKGHPIVLDYEEYGNSYFAEKGDEDDSSLAPDELLLQQQQHQPPPPLPPPLDPSLPADAVAAAESSSLVAAAPPPPLTPPPVAPDDAAANGDVKPQPDAAAAADDEAAALPPAFDDQIYNQKMREQCISGFCVALDAVDIENRRIEDEDKIEEMRCGHYELLISKMYAQEWRGGDPVYVARNQFKPLVDPAAKKPGKGRKRASRPNWG